MWVVVLAAARLAYLALWCPYNLIEDEAHYWEWSRRLDWSYYSKGPGIALAIAGATSLFGDAEWAIRTVAVFSSSLTMLAVAGLLRSVGCRDPRAVKCSLLCLALAPAFLMIALLSTIDGPFLACWALACWAAHRALVHGSGVAWIGLGASLAAGFLFKYTIVLLLPGLIVFAMVSRRRRLIPTHWGWRAAGGAIALLGVVPVVIWNAARGWPTIKHLLGHINASGGDISISDEASRYDWRWLPEFLGTQIGLGGPGMILSLLAVSVVWKGRRILKVEPADSARWGRVFLLLCGAPVFIFYTALTFRAEAEGNWALGAMVTLLPLAGWYVADAAKEAKARLAGDRVRNFLWNAAICLGLVAGAAMLRVDLLARVPNLGAIIPTGRLMGADRMARHAATLMSDLELKTGLKPMLFAQHYGRASLMAYYLPGRPMVFCSSSFMGGRQNQFDMWAETDLRSPQVTGPLLGRPAVLCGGTGEQWQQAFSDVRSIGGDDLTSRLDGETKKDRHTFIGIGFRGFGEGK